MWCSNFMYTLCHLLYIYMIMVSENHYQDSKSTVYLCGKTLPSHKWDAKCPWCKHREGLIESLLTGWWHDPSFAPFKLKV